MESFALKIPYWRLLVALHELPFCWIIHWIEFRVLTPCSTTLDALFLQIFYRVSWMWSDWAHCDAYWILHPEHKNESECRHNSSPKGGHRPRTKSNSGCPSTVITTTLVDLGLQAQLYEFLRHMQRLTGPSAPSSYIYGFAPPAPFLLVCIICGNLILVLITLNVILFYWRIQSMLQAILKLELANWFMLLIVVPILLPLILKAVWCYLLFMLYLSYALTWYQSVVCAPSLAMDFSFDSCFVQHPHTILWS